MALVTVSGEPGCRYEEVARWTAQELRFELVTESRLATMIADDFGPQVPIPDRAFCHVLAAIVARLATEHHLVVSVRGAELLSTLLPGIFRVHLVAPESRRTGSLMLERGLERPAARQELRRLEKQHREERKRRFKRAAAAPHLFDLVVNTEHMESEQITSLLVSAVRGRGLIEQGLLPAAAEVQLQFQLRLHLARHGIHPPGNVVLKRNGFAHPSEEIFANLLDFYRVAWEYEPRSFPIQWGKDGKVMEAFTPDFYLPEFDLYVELTTMKQSLVTRKNRKVKLLRSIYPQVNIQVFYQKDFQNLIFKYGLAERAAKL